MRTLPLLCLVFIALSGCDTRATCDGSGARGQVRRAYKHAVYRLLRGPGDDPAHRGEASFQAMVRHTQRHLTIPALRLSEIVTFGDPLASSEKRRCTGLMEAHWPPAVMARLQHQTFPAHLDVTLGEETVRHRITYRVWRRGGDTHVSIDPGMLELLRRVMGDMDPFAPIEPTDGAP